MHSLPVKIQDFVVTAQGFHENFNWLIIQSVESIQMLKCQIFSFFGVQTLGFFRLGLCTLIFNQGKNFF